MKIEATKKTETIIVETKEIDKVNISLTKEEATYLFHMIGCGKPSTMLESIEKSITTYHTQNANLLIDFDIYKLNRVLINPLYGGLKKALGYEEIPWI